MANPEEHHGTGVPVTGDTTEPVCPKCGADLIDTARWKPMTIEGHGTTRPFVVVWCRNCGVTLAIVPPDAGPSSTEA